MNHLQYLQQTADSLPDSYKKLCYFVLDNPKFRIGCGGSEHHHNYSGGLIEHVAEVTKYCEMMAGSGIDRTVLFTAAIWHDFHKIYEYEWDEVNNKVLKLPYKKEIGHIAGSFAECWNQMTALGFTFENRKKVAHCILSHHGRKEWGSPVEPISKEALLLHAADMMSANGA